MNKSRASKKTSINNRRRWWRRQLIKEHLMSYLVVLLAVLTRFLPHMPNFSPIFGALLFGGSHLKQRDAIWYPLALLAASDVVLTTVVYRMRMDPGQVITWLGFAAVALIGYWIHKRESVARIGFASLGGPTAFFIISNFGVWIGGHGSRVYAATWDGLAACYVAALPFYRNSLLASVAYTTLLFGAHEIYRRRHIGIATTAHAN
jgi:hypothetical protein